jgi:hypothetical protein
MSEETYRRFNRRVVASRSIDELLGMVKGVVFDGTVNREEALVLRAYLAANPDCATTWPWYVLIERLDSALKDDHISSEEEAELLDTLVRLAGGNPLVNEGDSATGLPIDRPRPPIDVKGRTFCFTGVFASGPRRQLVDVTGKLGGKSQDNVTKKLDYLVIGAIATRDWKHSSFGTKILRAMEFKSEGAEIAVVAEHHWAEVVQALESESM